MSSPNTSKSAPADVAPAPPATLEFSAKPPVSAPTPEVSAQPLRSPLDLLRASPWLVLAIACLIPLFWIVGENFAELLLWPLAKIALIVFVCYWADRTLHRVARLHWYSLALLPSRPGEEVEIAYLRNSVPVTALVWLTIGAWLRRGLMLAALVTIFAKAY